MKFGRIVAERAFVLIGLTVSPGLGRIIGSLHRACLLELATDERIYRIFNVEPRSTGSEDVRDNVRPCRLVSYVQLSVKMEPTFPHRPRKEYPCRMHCKMLT